MTSLKQLKEFRRINRIAGNKGRKIQPIKDWKIFKGDTVRVYNPDHLVMLLSGHDKGKKGTVHAIDRDVNELYVKGLNTKVIDERYDSMFDGLMEKEEPMHYSNVALVDPEDDKPCRVKFVFTQEGKRTRISTRSSRIIPMPVEEKEDFLDIIKPEGPSNTVPSNVVKQSYIPSFSTFEEDIAIQYGYRTIPSVAQSADPSEEPIKTDQPSWWKKVIGKWRK